LAAQAQISDPGYISGRSISADTVGTQVGGLAKMWERP